MNHTTRFSALLVAALVFAPPPAHGASRVLVRTPPPSVSLDRGNLVPPGLSALAAPDTTWLGYWSFDTGPGACTLEGWTSTDNTTQPVYIHVDNFAGLGGGFDNRLVPIEGSRSLWCGARPDPNDYTLCQYATLPGYGNSWYQTFGMTSCASVTGDATIDFLFTWDTDACCDGTVVQYALCDDIWNTVEIPGEYLNRIDGQGRRELISATVPAASHSGSLQFRLLFTSDGSWSDEDGMWNTDGAWVLDSLTVSDGGGVVLPTEYFEAESVGAQTTVSGNWKAGARVGYGDFASLFDGNDLLQEDPCVSQISCLWTFFNGSTADYSCGGYPGITVVPYVNARGQYIDNEIWSPVVPITGTGSTYEIGFDAYGVPVDPLVGWVWNVRSFVNGCPAAGWMGSGFLYFGDPGKWSSYAFQVGDLIDPAATEVQLSIGVLDVCQFYCGIAGTGQCHTPGPYFNNAWIRRIDTNGPAWTVDPATGLFQDNFANDGTTTGSVRTDAASDVSGSGSAIVVPGDSILVTVSDPEHGLAADPHTAFGSAVYLYVGVRPPGQPGKVGAALTQDTFRWPVVDSLTYGGNTWYCVRMDTAFSPSGTPRAAPAPDRFCVDLNDNLFTPGDTLYYVFAAQGGGGVTWYSRFTGTTDDNAFALSNPMEMTCLPTAGGPPGGRILYVDNADEQGVQPFFETAFDILGLADRVDRYDILAPGADLENGPASRVVNPLDQIVAPYHAIVWNSGTRTARTLQDGPASGRDKYDDALLLTTYLDNLDRGGGLYLSGDNLASDWYNLTDAGAVDLRSLYMNFAVLNDDHTAYGLGTSPLVVGVDSLCFDHTSGPDTLVVYGGCPEVERFDVLQATGLSTAQALYGDGIGGAVLSQQTTNALEVSVGVVLSGFSFHATRDIHETGIPARADHLADILQCLGAVSATPTPAAHSPYRTSLAQNYPNPFNPSTTIEFTLRSRARVTVRVYDVAGRRVRTLIDDERTPGATHRVTWDGRNDAGQSVASGVYFYRLEADGVVRTRKMVLLK